jgi:hypothetical protein
VIARVDGWGDAADNARKNRISEILRYELPRRGLGFWSGDSFGSGTFEVGVRVVNRKIAEEAISTLLVAEALDAGITFDEA